MSCEIRGERGTLEELKKWKYARIIDLSFQEKKIYIKFGEKTP